MRLTFDRSSSRSAHCRRPRCSHRQPGSNRALKARLSRLWRATRVELISTKCRRASSEERSISLIKGEGSRLGRCHPGRARDDRSSGRAAEESSRQTWRRTTTSRCRVSLRRSLVPCRSSWRRKGDAHFAMHRRKSRRSAKSSEGTWNGLLDIGGRFRLVLKMANLGGRELVGLRDGERGRSVSKSLPPPNSEGSKLTLTLPTIGSTFTGRP